MRIHEFINPKPALQQLQPAGPQQQQTVGSQSSQAQPTGTDPLTQPPQEPSQQQTVISPAQQQVNKNQELQQKQQQQQQQQKAKELSDKFNNINAQVVALRQSILGTQ